MAGRAAMNLDFLSTCSFHTGNFFARGATTCGAREQVHCETRVEDGPADRTPVAGRMTMDGNLVGKIIVGSRKTVELAERNLALHL